MFCDSEGAAIPIVEAFSSSTAPYPQQGVASVHDGDNSTKFVDAAFGLNGVQSTLTVMLPANSEIASYEFITANDNADRDPTSWVLESVTPGTEGISNRETLHTVTGFEPPTDRQTPTGKIYLISPPSSPSPPPTPPPVGYDYMIRFTDVKGQANGFLDGIQLSEIIFYNAAGNPIDVALATNPGGEQPENELAQNLFDGSTSSKWFDGNFATNSPMGSDLVFHIGSLEEVVTYQFVTANDQERRDPVSWQFGIWHGESQGFEVLSTVTGANAPAARYTSYPTTFGAHMPPSMPSPPSPPPSLPYPPYSPPVPPSPPGYSVYEFEFTAKRYPPVGSTDGIQLQALVLVDYNGDMLLVTDVTNPGGSSHPNEQPTNLVRYQAEGYTTMAQLDAGLAATANYKFHDANFDSNGKSIIRVTLPTSVAVAGYFFVTADDVPRRDPTAWVFRSIDSTGNTIILDMQQMEPPAERECEVHRGVLLEAASDDAAAPDARVPVAATSAAVPSPSAGAAAAAAVAAVATVAAPIAAVAASTASDTTASSTVAFAADGHQIRVHLHCRPQDAGRGRYSARGARPSRHERQPSHHRRHQQPRRAQSIQSVCRQPHLVSVARFHNR